MNTDNQQLARNYIVLSLWAAAALACAGPEVAQATVFFSSKAESGTCGNQVPLSEWDNSGSGGPGGAANAKMTYSCDTPVPGRTKYFRVGPTAANSQGTWNVRNVSQINLTPGVTYYFGAFVRFDRINGADIWHDTNQPDSYDKLLEFRGNTRWIILAGWPNSAYSGSYDHKFTFDLYSSPAYCTSCGPNEKWANVAPYGNANPFGCEYGRWYAVVMAYRPSSGGSAANGLVELYINGTKTASLAQKTQDATAPYLESFQFSGTIAQPGYDSPSHYRSLDNVIFADSLADVQAAGLMKDPMSSGTSALLAPTNLRLQ